MVHRQAEKYGDKVALKYRDYETSQWIPITWNKFSQTVRQAANALVALGVEEQRNIGIFSQNKPECLFTDFAAFANRLVTIPLYATSSSAQAQYIINDAQIRFLFVGEQFQYDAAFSAFGFCHSLQKLIIFDRNVVLDPRDKTSIYYDEFLALGKDLPHNDVVEERTARASDEDLANILYTSGTTGDHYQGNTPHADVQRSPLLGESVCRCAGEDSAGDRLAESDDAGCHQGGQDAQH